MQHTDHPIWWRFSDLSEPFDFLGPFLKHRLFDRDHICSSGTLNSVQQPEKLRILAMLPPAQDAMCRRNKKVVAFHSNAAIQDQKYEGEELNNIRRLSERRMMLTRAAAILSTFGLILTAIASEVCSYGYGPTETEMLEGMEPLPLQAVADNTPTSCGWWRVLYRFRPSCLLY